jgi:hypothetical protein
MNQQQVVPIYLIHASQVTDGFLKALKGLIMFQVTDVLADISLTSYDQGDRVLQVSADGQHRSLDR